MTIRGVVQTTKTNDYGFTSYKISNTWYGADSKGPPRASEGDMVEFEGFDKSSKDGSKTYPTIKLATLKKVVAPAAESPATTKAAYTAPTAGKDSYWKDKEAADKAKEPKIAYFASAERAIQAVDLYLRNGALDISKVKAADKLAILQGFVDTETKRIFNISQDPVNALASFGEPVDGLDTAEVKASAKKPKKAAEPELAETAEGDEWE